MDEVSDWQLGTLVVSESGEGWISDPLGSGRRMSTAGKERVRRIWEMQPERREHFSEEPPQHWR